VQFQEQEFALYFGSVYVQADKNFKVNFFGRSWLYFMFTRLSLCSGNRFARKTSGNKGWWNPK